MANCVARELRNARVGCDESRLPLHLVRQAGLYRNADKTVNIVAGHGRKREATPSRKTSRIQWHLSSIKTNDGQVDSQ